MMPGSQPLGVTYYRATDEDSLIIGTDAGSCDYGRTLEGETRVTEVLETADSVTITVRNFTLWSGPCAGVGVPIELPVELDAPLGDRAVFDPYHAVPLDDGD